MSVGCRSLSGWTWRDRLSEEHRDEVGGGQFNGASRHEAFAAQRRGASRIVDHIVKTYDGLADEALRAVATTPGDLSQHIECDDKLPASNGS